MKYNQRFAFANFHRVIIVRIARLAKKRESGGGCRYVCMVVL